MQPEPIRQSAEDVALFGAQVEQEVDRSPTLKYLIDNAEEQERAAILALGKINPFKPEDIAPLQTQLRAARLIREWIAGAVMAGKNAVHILAADDAQPLRPETASGHVDE